MAEREGLHKAVPFNNIGCLTQPNGSIEPKGFSCGLSNRPPTPETETAAPVGAGTAAKTIENPTKIFKDGFYTALTVKAIARLHPKLAAGSHYVMEPARNRWRIIVRRRGQEHVEFFETKAAANRARQFLTDEGLPGFVTGGVA